MSAKIFLGFVRGSRSHRSRTGSKKAVLFPEPVFAVTNKSAPESAAGIPSNCTGVALSNFETASSKGFDNPREEKLIRLFRAASPLRQLPSFKNI
jgi:hypothetical protein